MKKFTVQGNFTAGELSPRLYAHTDLAKYKNGLKTATNCTILPHGPIRRRNGFKFITEAKDSTYNVRLIKFQYDSYNSYILEFGHNYIRFFKNSGIVSDSAGGLTNGDFKTNLTGWTDGDTGTGVSVWQAGQMVLNGGTSTPSLTNGTFTTDLTGWVDGDTGTGVSIWQLGQMVLNGGTSGTALRSQAISLVAGQYTITCTLANQPCRLNIGTSAGGTQISVNDIAVGANSFNFTIPSNGTYYIAFASGVNSNSGIDNVTLSTISGTTGIALRSQAVSLTTGTYTISFRLAGHSARLNIGTSAGGTQVTVKDIILGINTFTFDIASNGTYYIAFANAYNSNTGIDDVVLSSIISPVVLTTTYASSELFEISYAQFGKILYLFHKNHAPATLIWNDADDDWTLIDITFRPIATDEIGVQPSLTLTPSATTGTGINFTTSSSYWVAADVGRQIINEVGTGRASITSISSGTVAVATIIEAFPSTSAIAAGNWSLDLSPVTDVTSSGYKEGSTVTLTTSINAWKSQDGLLYVNLHNGIARILSYTSSTVASAVIEKALEDDAKTENFSVERPVWSSTFDYPSVCALHQSRLFAASTTRDPQTIWASESGIYDAFGTGAEDSDALNFDISTKDISKISWMMNLRGQLAVGTTGAELTLDSGSQSASLTPASLAQQVRGYQGSNIQQPIGLNDEVIYIGKSGRKVNAFRYDFQIDNYVSEDLLFLAEHLSDGGIKELTYAQDPDRQLLAVLNNGSMLACSYIREQQVLGWSKYETDGEIESVQTIPYNSYDQVWLVVKRDIDGESVRYIEILDNSIGDENIDGFSDSYLTYSSPFIVTAITKANPGIVTTSTPHGFSNGDYIKFPDIEGMTELKGLTFIVASSTTSTFAIHDIDGNNINTSSYETFTSGNVHKLVTTISGLDHLEGKEVQLKVDGAVHLNKTVSSGSVTLDRKAYEVTAGLTYETTIQTLPVEFPADMSNTSGQGQRVRWVRPIFRLYKSTLPQVNGEMIPARDASNLMDSKLPLYTGDINFSNLTWKDGFSSSLNITTSLPYPLTLLGIFGSIENGSQ